MCSVKIVDKLVIGQVSGRSLTLYALTRKAGCLQIVWCKTFIRSKPIYSTMIPKLDSPNFQSLSFIAEVARESFWKFRHKWKVPLQVSSNFFAVTRYRSCCAKNLTRDIFLHKKINFAKRCESGRNGPPPICKKNLRSKRQKCKVTAVSPFHS